MDDRVHDVGPVQDDGDGLAHTDHDAGEQHVAAALHKAVCHAGGVQTAQDPGGHAHDQEQRGQLVDVKAELDHAIYQEHDGDQKGQEHQNVAGGQRFIPVDIRGAGAQTVQLVHRAAGGVFLDPHGVDHDKGGVEQIEGHQDHQAQLDAGKQRQAGDALGHADGERVGAACAVSGGHRTEDDPERREGVKAHGQTDGQHQRQERQELLVVGDKGGPQGEDQHTAGDQKELTPLHFADQGAHSGADRARLLHDTKGTADDEQKSDDTAAALNAFGDGHEQFKEPGGIGVYIGERSGVYDHPASVGVFHPGEGTGGNDIAGQRAKQDDADDDNERIGDVHLLGRVFILGRWGGCFVSISIHTVTS